MDQLHNIRTPEHIELQYKLAGIGNRFLAFALDTLILFGTLAFLWSAVAWASTYLSRFSVEVIAVGLCLSFIIYYGYFLVFETIWNGQTPGKRKLGIRVIREDGRPITFFEALIRNLMRIVDSFPPFVYAVGSVSIFFSAKAKRLGDYVAGTVVIREYAESVPNRLEAPAESPAGATADMAIDTTKLGEAELELVAAFLRRRAALDVATRRRMARRLAQALLSRLGLEAQIDPERFLEQIHEAHQARGKYLS